MRHARLVCRNCGHEQDIDAQYVGQQFACPGCGQGATAEEREAADQPPPPAAGAAGKAAGIGEKLRAFRGMLHKVCAFPSSLVDALLDGLKGLFPPGRYGALASMLVLAAQIAAPIYVLCAFATGVGMDLFIGGLGGALLFIFLRYVADKGLEMLACARQGSVIHFSGPGLFRISAAGLLLLCLLVPLCAVLISDALVDLWGAGGFDEIVFVCMGVFGLGVTGYFLMYCLLHPEEMLGVRFVETTTAGEEFLSLLAVSVRVLVRLTPVLYGLGVIGATLALIHTTGNFVFNEYSSTPAVWAAQDVRTNLCFLALVLALPLLVHFLSNFLYFLLDLGLASLRTARNTARVAENTEKQH